MQFNTSHHARSHYSRKDFHQKKTLSVSPSIKMRKVEDYEEVLHRLNSFSGSGHAFNTSFKAATSSKTLVSQGARSTGAVAANQQK